MKIPRGFLEYPDGLTIRELKDYLANFPDVDGWGEPTEVWIMTSPSMSSVCTEIVPLNYRVNEHGQEWADIALSPACLAAEDD